MFGSSTSIPLQTGLAFTTAYPALTSTTSPGGIFEAVQSEYAQQNWWSVKVTSPSSLVMTLGVDLYDPVSNTWIRSPQDWYVQAAGTAPNAVAGNTASTTVVVGGKVSNCLGLTNITNTMTAWCVVPGLGMRLRLNPALSGGTCTFAFAYIGAAVMGIG